MLSKTKAGSDDLYRSDFKEYLKRGLQKIQNC
jgi:hypothetical protein